MDIVNLSYVYKQNETALQKKRVDELVEKSNKVM